MDLMTKTDSETELVYVQFRIRSIARCDDKHPPLSWIVAFDFFDVGSLFLFLFTTREQMSVDSLRLVTT